MFSGGDEKGSGKSGVEGEGFHRWVEEKDVKGKEGKYEESGGGDGKEEEDKQDSEQIW